MSGFKLRKYGSKKNMFIAGAKTARFSRGIKKSLIHGIHIGISAQVCAGVLEQLSFHILPSFCALLFLGDFHFVSVSDINACCHFKRAYRPVHVTKTSRVQIWGIWFEPNAQNYDDLFTTARCTYLALQAIGTAKPGLWSYKVDGARSTDNRRDIGLKKPPGPEEPPHQGFVFEKGNYLKLPRDGSLWQKINILRAKHITLRSGGPINTLSFGTMCIASVDTENCLQRDWKVIHHYFYGSDSVGDTGSTAKTDVSSTFDTIGMYPSVLCQFFHVN